MRCVNETLPPRPRLRLLLMTMRLSTSSLAGMARTLVAVGTVRLADMLAAVLAAVPRSRASVPPVGRGPAGAAAACGAVGPLTARSVSHLHVEIRGRARRPRRHGEHRPLPKLDSLSYSPDGQGYLAAAGDLGGPGRWQCLVRGLAKPTRTGVPCRAVPA